MQDAFTNKDLETLFEALHYLKMAELRDILKSFQLPHKDKKPLLIDRIVLFLKTGDCLPSPTIPKHVYAPKGYKRHLSPEEPIYYKTYKSDLETRLFFKQLIGAHFHFTAYGNDWLEEQWLEGKNPTFQDYADFWQAEHLRRKTSPADPKKEWAYLNFCQKYLQKHPNAPRKDMMSEWKKLQKEKAEFVFNMLKTKKAPAKS